MSLTQYIFQLRKITVLSLFLSSYHTHTHTHLDIIMISSICRTGFIIIFGSTILTTGRALEPLTESYDHKIILAYNYYVKNTKANGSLLNYKKKNGQGNCTGRR